MVEKGCDTEGLLFDIDLKALEPGRMANLVAMIMYCGGKEYGKRGRKLHRDNIEEM